jgi:ABC-type sugar transport system ATPase subunit
MADMAGMKEAYLKMQNISKHFSGIYVLKKVNLEAFAGEALALLGANGAGKSTLMNILGGVLRQDEGEILIDQESTEIKNTIDAEKIGIGFIHQELALCPSMSVAENIFISRFPTKTGVINKKYIEEESKKVLARLGCSINVRKTIRDLSAGDRQLVEIARALISNAQILIFDEPTSSLAIKEKEQFFDVLRSLKKENKVIIYITHFLEETFAICDRVQVLRNGETVGTGNVSDFDHNDIVTMMVGDIEIDTTKKSYVSDKEDVVLRVSDLYRRDVLDFINFDLARGEVLGLWGLMGSGRTELMRAIRGLDDIDGGKIEIKTDKKMRPVSPKKTSKYIGLITENRREDGLFLSLSVRENISITNLSSLLASNRFFVNQKKEEKVSKDLVQKIDIKVNSIQQTTGTLSGGNQQKVILARWLGKSPPILLMDEPTRGVDVGAKNEIHKMIKQLAADGFSLLIVSSEIEEIMELSDRYLVISGGSIVKELPGDASEKELMLWASKRAAGKYEETVT